MKKAIVLSICLMMSIIGISQINLEKPICAKAYYNFDYYSEHPVQLDHVDHVKAVASFDEKQLIIKYQEEYDHYDNVLVIDILDREDNDNRRPSFNAINKPLNLKYYIVIDYDNSIIKVVPLGDFEQISMYYWDCSLGKY